MFPSYVAIGLSGKILTSSDGTSWTSRTSGTTSNLFGVTYGNSKFLTLLSSWTGVIGTADNGSPTTGTVLTSSNGTTWTSTSTTCSTCDNSSFELTDVTYGNSTYVAIGQSGKILTSSDGTSWDNRSSGTTSNLAGITYGNSKFLTLLSSWTGVIGTADNGSPTTGTVLTSSNGTTWTSTSTTCSTCDNSSFELTDVTYGNSTYVAIGQSGKILTSSDGTSWTSRTSGTTSNLFGVTYGNSKFLTLLSSWTGVIGTADNGSPTTGTALTSSNGTTWTSTSTTCSTCDNSSFTLTDVTYKE